MASELNGHAVGASRQPTGSALLEVSIRRKEFLTKSGPQQILGQIDFKLEPGRFVSVLGPSGCGKTTMLRCIAGIDNDYDGDIRLAGEKLTGPSIDRGVVFQEPRLLPWLTVFDNIGFAEPGAQVSAERIDELIDLVGLRGHEQRQPKQLSGGMAQRVSLARALYNLPKLLLLDEPFSALDNFHRGRLQGELHEIVVEAGVTSLLVTHDLDEALALSDRIYVMAGRPGRIAEVLTIDIDRPRDRSDAQVVGFRRKLEDVLASAGAATL